MLAELNRYGSSIFRIFPRRSGTSGSGKQFLAVEVSNASLWSGRFASATSAQVAFFTAAYEAVIRPLMLIPPLTQQRRRIAGAVVGQGRRFVCRMQSITFRNARRADAICASEWPIWAMGLCASIAAGDSWRAIR